jgi:hypothetical protein
VEVRKPHVLLMDAPVPCAARRSSPELALRRQPPLCDVRHRHRLPVEGTPCLSSQDLALRPGLVAVSFGDRKPEIESRRRSRRRSPPCATACVAAVAPPPTAAV